MKQVQIYQCDYCKRTSFHKSNMRKHEKECFYNPDTHCCATCLWFSRANDLDGTVCFLNKFQTPEEGKKPKLKIGCKHWIDFEVTEGYDLFGKDRLVLEKMMQGDRSFFNNLPPQEIESLNT